MLSESQKKMYEGYDKYLESDDYDEGNTYSGFVAGYKFLENEIKGNINIVSNSVKSKIEEAAIKDYSSGTPVGDFDPVTTDDLESVNRCAFKRGAHFGYALASDENGARIKQLEKEIDRVIEVADGNADACRLMMQEIDRNTDKIQSLKDEIEVLRRYGNKDCTAMADEALTQKAEE